MNTLVIDAGTTSIRGILYTEAGEPAAQCRRACAPQSTGSGIVEEDASVWRDAIFEIARSVQEQASVAGVTVDAISVTAQRSSVIPVSPEGVPLAPAITWQDTRNAALCETLQCYDPMVRSVTGAGVNTVFSGSRMAWLRESEPLLYARAAKLLNVGEYLLFLMTGRFCSDHTYGSRSNLMDLKTREWSAEMLRLFGIDAEKLCTLLAPGSICGAVQGEFAAFTGIRTGTLVITAGGDQQCGALGQGAFSPEHASLVTGTGAFMIAVSDRIPAYVPPGVLCNCAASPDLYILEASVLSCCSAFDWFCGNFYGDPIPYAEVDTELERSGAAPSPCVVLPYFRGKSLADASSGQAASFLNVTLSTTRAEMLKGLVEGIFFEISRNLEQLRQCTSLRTLSISGGLTKSAVLNQMQANIYGIPLFRRLSAEATAEGALMSAWAALGVTSSLEEAYRTLCAQDPPQEIGPTPEIAADYRRHRESWDQMRRMLC
jgi:xylulokinase/glycerol kinase